MPSLTAPVTSSKTFVSGFPEPSEHVLITETVIIYGGRELIRDEGDEFWTAIAPDVENNYTLFFGS